MSFSVIGRCEQHLAEGYGTRDVTRAGLKARPFSFVVGD